MGMEIWFHSLDRFVEELKERRIPIVRRCYYYRVKQSSKVPFLVFYVVLSAKDGREILKFQASYYNCIAYAWPREDLEKKEAEIRAKIEEELGKKLNGITIKWGEYVRRGSHA